MGFYTNQYENGATPPFPADGHQREALLSLGELRWQWSRVSLAAYIPTERLEYRELAFASQESKLPIGMKSKPTGKTGVGRWGSARSRPWTRPCASSGRRDSRGPLCPSWSGRWGLPGRASIDVREQGGIVLPGVGSACQGEWGSFRREPGRRNGPRGRRAVVASCGHLVQ